MILSFDASIFNDKDIKKSKISTTLLMNNLLIKNQLIGN